MSRLRALSLLAAACLQAVPAGAGAAQIEGVARRLPEGTEVYRERHHLEGDSHRIEYLAPDGRAIAEKWLGYGCSDSAPDFEQRDLRTGRTIGGRWEDGAYLLLRGEESRRVRPGQPFVASSGFDRFVREHWEALASGSTIAFDFALPARLDTFRLRIRPDPEPAPADGAAHRFVIEPDAALLRAFVAPIRLDYDAGGRLLRYRGLSNLADADGGSLDVDIRYVHAPAGVPGTGAGDEPPASAARKPPVADCPTEAT